MRLLFHRRPWTMSRTELAATNLPDLGARDVLTANDLCRHVRAECERGADFARIYFLHDARRGGERLRQATDKQHDATDSSSPVLTRCRLASTKTHSICFDLM